MLAGLLCTPSLAAEQGDFSLLVNGGPVTFTDAAPETVPPAGATVVDLWELLTTPVSEL